MWPAGHSLEAPEPRRRKQKEHKNLIQLFNARRKYLRRRRLQNCYSVTQRQNNDNNNEEENIKNTKFCSIIQFNDSKSKEQYPRRKRENVKKTRSSAQLFIQLLNVRKAIPTKKKK